LRTKTQPQPIESFDNDLQEIAAILAAGYQSCALPANQWTRIACSTKLATNSAIRMLIGGFASWTGPLSLFGAQVAALGGPGAYQRTPGNCGLHTKVRFDTDILAQVRHGAWILSDFCTF
jgi:hypothetical protein